MHIRPLPTLSTFALFVLCTTVEAYTIRPFRVDLSAGISRMVNSIQQTRIPSAPPSPPRVQSSTLGISEQWLQTLQKTWVDGFDWDRHQNYMNDFNQYKVEIEGLDIHFVHAKSKASHGTSIIPIILTHGWPGSFLEFLPVVEALTRSIPLKDGRSVSFDVIVPSLPGFAFSAPPPSIWTVNDTARIWNTLMVDVLGYTSGYSVAGTDWGALVNWCLLNEYPHAKAAHFNFLAIVPPSLDDLASAGIALSDFDRSGIESSQAFFQTGTAYFHVHQTRPFTLGLALADNPMGQLAWIADKYHDWSDPSLVDVDHILTTVSLYYLTGSFPSSLYIYAQNSGFSSSDTKAKTNKPFGYGAFKWEGIRHPEAFVRALGNVTFYKEHEAGGHFAPHEVPESYAEDIIELMSTNFPLTPVQSIASGTPKNLSVQAYLHANHF